MMQRKLSVLLMCWCLLLMGCPADNNNQGQEKVENRTASYEQQIEILVQRLETNPGDIDAMIAAGKLAYDTEHWKDAMVFLGEAIDQMPRNSELRFMRAMTFLHTGDRRRWKGKLRELVKTDRNYTPLLDELSIVAFEERDWESFSKYTGYIENSATPSTAGEAALVVRKAWQTGDQSLGEKLEKLMSDSGNDWHTGYWLAQYHIRHVDIQSLDKVISNVDLPEDLRLLLEIRRLQFDQKFEEAAELIAQESFEDDRFIIASLTNDYLRGNSNSVLEFLKSSPEAENISRAWSYYFSALASYDLGESDSIYFDRESNPFNAGLVALKSYVYGLRRNDLLDMKKVLEEVGQNYPGNALVIYFRGRMELDEGNFNAACDLFSEASNLGLRKLYSGKLVRVIDKHCSTNE